MDQNIQQATPFVFSVSVQTFQVIQSSKLQSEGLGKMLIVQSLILFARWYTKMLLMTVGDKTCLKFTQEFTQVFEMQNLKVLQDSFKKSEILQILEMLHFKIIQIFRHLT